MYVVFNNRCMRDKKKLETELLSAVAICTKKYTYIFVVYIY